MREKYGFTERDKILLWGGGIWNWFDPLSLIKAMKRLSQKRSDIKLVFMGVKNPDPAIPEMSMSHEALECAQQLHLLNQSVFFNHGWVSYEERQNFLLDATLGVSTHFDHLETRYAFRTRMLDYIWAKLPILATMGDSFAELIEKYQLGEIVPYGDDQAIASSIESLVDDSSRLEAIKANLSKQHHHFYWDTVIEPIRRMINSFIQEPCRKLKMKDLKMLSHHVALQIKDKGFLKSFQLFIKKLSIF